MNSKYIVIGLIVVILIGALVSSMNRMSTVSSSDTPTTTPVVSTSTPGTTPTGPQTAVAVAQINKGVTALGVTITPLEVLEDSRCPSDVVCIQAGTVRLRATLESGLGKADQVFTLDKPITTEAEIVTLIKVEPITVSTVPRKPADYVFAFKIDKR